MAGSGRGLKTTLHQEGPGLMGSVKALSGNLNLSFQPGHNFMAFVVHGVFHRVILDLEFLPVSPGFDEGLVGGMDSLLHGLSKRQAMSGELLLDKLPFYLDTGLKDQVFGCLVQLIRPANRFQGLDQPLSGIPLVPSSPISVIIGELVMVVMISLAISQKSHKGIVPG